MTLKEECPQGTPMPLDVEIYRVEKSEERHEELIRRNQGM
jgi:hypothetical protein